MKTAWSGERFVPKLYAGPPVSSHYINILSLLLDNPTWGTKEDKDHLRIFFYEPGFMYKWIEKQIAESNKNLKDKFQVVQLYGRKGILVTDSDKTTLPTAPIFTIGHLPWVENFDKINQVFFSSLSK